MRKLLFLLPGTTKKFACGGLFAELKTLALTQKICPAEVVTYRQQEPNTLYLPNLLKSPPSAPFIYVASWGFDVPKLVKQLRGFPVIYHAHSSEYGFWLPSRVPIVTVSRNTLGYWGQRSPHALLYYLPNEISDEFTNLGLERDIDVLVHARKSSSYLLNQLVPALTPHCHVEVIDGFVDSLSELFNRSKVYLYDSAEYWATQGVTEGFGLQPLEAIASGCQVFSSVNHGLSDYLDPGFNCHKIAGYSTGYDVARILEVVNSQQTFNIPDSLISEYRQENILFRLDQILQDLNHFFDYRSSNPEDIQSLSATRILQLRSQKILNKIQEKLTRE